MKVHRALIAALAGNAPPYKPEVVLSQAVTALRVEGEAICGYLYHDDKLDRENLSTAAYALAGRLRALEEFLNCLQVGYHQDHEDDFAFDPEEENAAPSPGEKGGESL